MSTLILHDKNETKWNSLGYGPLTNVIEPKVTRARNGEYTLEFRYPMFSPLFDKIEKGNWVVADAGIKQNTLAQRFEIQKVTKPMDGIVSVYAEHYRYQLLRSVLKKAGTKKGTVNELMRFLLENSEPKMDFTVKSVLRDTELEMDLTDPFVFPSTMDAFGGTAGSILDKFGGEYVFDNNVISLPNEAGEHTKVVVAYGKNLTDINQEESIENTFTTIYPWAKIKEEGSDEEKIITVDGNFVDGEYVNNYRERRIEAVDFSQRNPKNKAELLTMAQQYVISNKIGVPKVSIKASFVDLSSNTMGGTKKYIDSVDLCDYIHVYFKDLKISTEAQIIKTVYRPDLERFESVELGDARTNLGDVITDKVDEVDKKLDDYINGANSDWMGMKEDIDNFNDVLNNPGKGKVVVYPSLSDPQEIYITDNEDLNLARKMWRWSEAGLAYSSTGRGGPWTVGMTKDGQIVADLINTGTLKAIDIMGVTITGSTVSGGRVVNEGTEFRATFSNGRIVWFDKTRNKEFFSIDAGDVKSGGTGNTVGLRPLQGDSIYIGRDTAWVDSKYGFYRFNEGSWQVELSDYDYSGMLQRMGTSLWFITHGYNSDPSMLSRDSVEYSYFGISARKNSPEFKMFFRNGAGHNRPSTDRISGDMTGHIGAIEMRGWRRDNSTGKFLADNSVRLDNGYYNNDSGNIRISSSYGDVTVAAKTFKVSGTKNATVRTENYGDRLLNAYETPELYFADYGEAVTGEDGKVRIDIDPIFAETIVTSRYMVFLTPTEMVKCAVIHEDVDHFIIQAEKSGVLIRWNLVAHRLGYQDVRLTLDEKIHLDRLDSESELTPEEKDEFEEAYQAIEKRKEEEENQKLNTMMKEGLL